MLIELGILIVDTGHGFGSAMGSGRKGVFDIKYSLSFRVRNGTDVNVCLENIVIENEVLGMGRVGRMSPQSPVLPLNVGARRTEEAHVLICFPNEVERERKGSTFTLQIRFDFSDRVLTKEIAVVL